MEERDILLMAGLIAAVRTARFPPEEFRGMASPRIVCEISSPLWMARQVAKRADSSRQAFLDAEQVDAERSKRDKSLP